MNIYTIFISSLLIDSDKSDPSGLMADKNLKCDALTKITPFHYDKNIENLISDPI